VVVFVCCAVAVSEIAAKDPHKANLKSKNFIDSPPVQLSNGVRVNIQ
jgi:hypothetical protein